MGKSKSQWDFGELFPSSPGNFGATGPPESRAVERQVMSVSELTTQIRALLERQIGQIWVSGEVTNLRAQSSGHMYFTLKDAAAQLRCVLFSREKVSHRELLADGQKVQLQGDVTVYEARGQYQLIVRAVELQGVGALQIAFEKLKLKLATEGLFESERKRLLPKYPQRIGLVTSPTGAAIRDVLHVVQRRNPGLEIILVPCRVQGQGAAEEITEAVKLLNRYSVESLQQGIVTSGSNSSTQRFKDSTSLDLILITRGGGSLEDMWAFNEEIVARAIFESAIPIVSGVGHEIDFTIADFVADVRAATPSAAAEIITEGVFASRQLIGNLTQRMMRMHPRRQLNEHLQRLDDVSADLQRQTRQRVNERLVTCRNLASRLRQMRPNQFLKQRREFLKMARKRMSELACVHFKNSKTSLATAGSRLRLLGPEQVLARGYSITMDAATGNVLRDAKKVKGGQKIKTRLKSGEIFSEVKVA